jgi:hypothetical protein
MPESDERARNKGESASPNTKGDSPQHQGGDALRKAKKWGAEIKPQKDRLPRKIGTTKTQAQRADGWSRPKRHQSQACELANMEGIEVGTTQKVPTR